MAASNSTFDSNYNEYLLLGLNGDESNTQIRIKYLTLVEQLNPETGRSPDPEQFQKIKEAYKIIQESKIADLDTSDPYKVFGINNNSTVKDINAAYRILVLKHHPDKGKTPGEIFRLTAQFKKLTEMREQLVRCVKSIPDAKNEKSPEFKKMPGFNGYDEFCPGLFAEITGQSKKEFREAAPPSPCFKKPFFNPAMFAVNNSKLYIQERINTYKNSKNKIVAAIANKACIDSINSIISSNKDYLQSKDKDGNTLVHIACMVARDDVLLLLHQHNADFELKNNKGMAAAPIAVLVGSVNCMKVLCETVKVRHLRDSIAFSI